MSGTYELLPPDDRAERREAAKRAKMDSFGQHHVWGMRCNTNMNSALRNTLVPFFGAVTIYSLDRAIGIDMIVPVAMIMAGCIAAVFIAFFLAAAQVRARRYPRSCWAAFASAEAEMVGRAIHWFGLWIPAMILIFVLLVKHRAL